MAPRPYSALSCIETSHGRVIIRAVFAKAQKQFVLVFDGDQAAIRLLLPGWKPKTPASRRTQLTPPIPITTQMGITTFFEQVAPKLRARIDGGDAFAKTGTTPPAPAYHCIGELAALVQRETESTVRSTSASTYRAQWTRLLQLIHPNTRLHDLCRDRLQALVGQLVEQGTAATTIRNLFVTLNKAMARATQDGLLRLNPLDRIRLPHAVRRPRKSVTKAQRQKLMEVAREHGRDATLIVMLGAYSGLRRGEILGLRWDDVDLVNRVLRIRRSEVFQPKSGDRAVPICSVLHEALLRYRRPSGYVVRPKATEAGPHRYIFRRLLRTVAVEAKLPWLTCHDLRRAFATCASEDGVNAFRLRRWLGHSRITQTADYVLDDDQYDDAIEGPRLGECVAVLSCKEPTVGWEAA